MKSRLRRWRIRLMHWEYWPWQIVYFPIFMYWIFLSLRTGSPLYFSMANPKFRNGGLLGESKFNILRMIPEQYRPKMFRARRGQDIFDLTKQMNTAGLSFPVMAKPDVGERGFMVQKICHQQDLEQYAASLGHDFIIQEFVGLPLESGIFYYRFPGEAAGVVSSVVVKEMLSVTGDGRLSLGALIDRDDRAFLQRERLRGLFAGEWDAIIPEGEKRELVSIGNHCLGTTFLNGNHLITPALESALDRLASSIEGFYYGRFDVRAASEEALETGAFKVLELNGAGAEPAHIYHPGASFLEGQKTLFHHWTVMFKISQMNHRQKGTPYPNWRRAWNEYRRFLPLKRIRPTHSFSR